MNAILHNEDCLVTMAGMDPASLDSIVTDPPYGLSFMGKDWDHGVPGVHFWTEALRVAKPGSHLLAFGGTRTFHRLAVAIEDAGWEIRDTVMWVYGSGFPKSLDVSKAIDRAAGAEREMIVDERWAKKYPNGPKGKTTQLTDGGRSNRIGTPMKGLPTTEAAKQWQGWGTALKPAWEPIIMARKPLEGTVAENVQKYGVGALNIDGCRVATNADLDDMSRDVSRAQRDSPTWKYGSGFRNETNYRTGVLPSGRWPANVIHDGSEEVVEGFPSAGNGHWSYKPAKDGGIYKYGLKDMEDGGSDRTVASASRFFYCAKASRSERNMGCEGMGKKQLRWSSGEQSPGTFQAEGTDRFAANHHPTVKPLALMEYLVKLVTPPGGLVYDPFMGSGTTGMACVKNGYRFIGSEMEKEYCEIARKRIEAVEAERGLFREVVNQ